MSNSEAIVRVGGSGLGRITSRLMGRRMRRRRRRGPHTVTAVKRCGHQGCEGCTNCLGPFKLRLRSLIFCVFFRKISKNIGRITATFLCLKSRATGEIRFVIRTIKRYQKIKEWDDIQIGSLSSRTMYLARVSNR